MKFNYGLLVASFAFLLLSCSDEPVQPNAKELTYKRFTDSLVTLRKDANFDFSKFDFWVDSTTRSPAQITPIETTLRNGFFKKSPTDDYDKTRDGDGYDLAIHYTLTNPYPTAKKVGFYDYDFVGSKEFFTYTIRQPLKGPANAASITEATPGYPTAS